MRDTLLLPVTFEGEELEFPIRLAHTGFQRRFVVEVDGTDVLFERDDANDVRAVIAQPEATMATPPSAALLQAVAEVIAQLG